MKRHRSLAFLLSLLLGAAIPVSGYADNIIQEVDTPPNVNQPIFQAQKLPAAEPLDVQGVLGVVSGPAVSDLDFYSFTGHEGDIVTLDIDCGYACGQRSVDTIIAVFGDTANYYPMLREDDDAYPADPGSNSPWDARIDNFRLPYTGRYIVGVSNYPHFFMDGGLVTPGWIQDGDYRLIITGATPTVKIINIAVRPDAHVWTPINPNSKGVIPVALLGDQTFDVSDVDTSTLKFGQSGKEASLMKCQKKPRDVNQDGRPDLVCFFSNRAAHFTFSTLEGKVTGAMKDGTQFAGQAPLKFIPRAGKKAAHAH